MRALLFAAASAVVWLVADLLLWRVLWGSWPWQAGHAICERCRRLRELARCVNCERDLCRACARDRACAHSTAGEHRA